MERVIHRVVNLIDDAAQGILNMNVDVARTRLLDERVDALLSVRGSFALAARNGDTVLMARSLDRPMRYFLAKEVEGPMLVIARRVRLPRPVSSNLHAHGSGASRNRSPVDRLS